MTTACQAKQPEPELVSIVEVFITMKSVVIEAVRFSVIARQVKLASRLARLTYQFVVVFYQ